MANFKNTNYSVITTKQTLPASANKTGTIATIGKNVIGTGTSFKTEMPVGSWLVSLTQNEIRKVVSVNSDTDALLSNAFTGDLAALTVPSVIHSRDTNVNAITVSIKSGFADGQLDGVVFRNGTGLTFSKEGNQRGSTGDWVDPIIVDGTGTEILAGLLK